MYLLVRVLYCSTLHLSVASGQEQAMGLLLRELTVITPFFLSVQVSCTDLDSLRCWEIFYHYINFEGGCWCIGGAWHYFDRITRCTGFRVFRRYDSQVTTIRFAAQILYFLFTPETELLFVFSLSDSRYLGSVLATRRPCLVKTVYRQVLRI